VSRAISDYYRSPDGLVEFATSAKLQGDPGFFKFDGITCFGRSTGPVSLSADAELADCGSKILENRSGAVLEFDPDEISENLRRERYTVSGRKNSVTNLSRRGARSAYYALRPLLPVSVRKHIQRMHASGWKDVVFPQWPLDVSVDALLERLLALAMQSSGTDRIPFIWFWPDGHNAAVILTHDVETTEGRDFCSKLMDLNDAFELRASFQVVPEERYEVPSAYLEEIRNRGSEVNIHDLNHDGSLFENRDQFVRRAAKIREYAKSFGAVGFRAAILYRNPDWLRDLDFTYDMSFPNSAPLDPQRGGCCTVMPYFIGETVELPLTTVQDYSLFHVLGTYEMDLWERQIATLLERHGLLTFLVHPDYVIERKPQDFYKRLLQRVQEVAAERNCWKALPREVAYWWKQRHAMTLVNRDTHWEIRGDGAERARLAWAVLDHGKITYSLDGPRSTLQDIG
jgi:hypothetical protein